MKRRFLIVPFLFLLASLLQLIVVASNVVSPDQVLRPLLLLWLVLGLLIWPAHRLTGDWNWTAIFLTILVLGFASSGSFFSTALTFVIVFGVCALAVLRLRRVKITTTHLMYVLAGTGLFFTGYAIVSMSAILGRIPWDGYRQAVSAARNYALEALSGPAAQPDIYYIVLDGYARSDVLQEIFAFDNAEFLAYLQQTGFVIPIASYSNFPATPLSIASTLNMDYIQALVPALGGNPQRWLMAPFIDHSRVRALLESQGYQTISISTNWTITDNPTTDRYIQPLPVVLNDFEGFVLDMTPLGLLEPALQTVATTPTASSHRKIIRHNFRALAEVASLGRPKFVMAHIISPHPPFVFDRHGNAVDTTGSFTFQDANEFPGSLKEYSQRYVEQVQFVNGQLKETIQTILAQSATPPVIILQADHGSGLLTDLSSPQNTCIRERFSPFAAYYFPNLAKEQIPSEVSAVNIFRILFNEYFQAGLPLLENRQYFYRDTQAYYDFVDVTGRMNETCVLPRE